MTDSSNASAMMSLANASDVAKINYIIAMSGMTVPETAIDLPEEYHLDPDGISKFLANGGTTQGLKDTAVGNNLIVEAIFSDTTLEIFNTNNDEASSKTTDVVWKYQVVSVGDKVTHDIKVGDRIEMHTRNVARVPIVDKYHRRILNKAIRKLDKADFEAFYKAVPRITYHDFFVVNPIDVYLKHR